MEQQKQPNKLNKLANLTNRSSVFEGLIIMLFGLITLRGGSIAVQATATSMPNTIHLDLPQWICWLMIWLGLDEAISRGRITGWILNRTLAPVTKGILNNTIGEERVKSIGNKLRRFNNADSK